MIRLFAPPTSDAVLRRSALTAGNLLLHVLALVVLAVPIGQAIESGLLDRSVVYLVPAEKPGGIEHSLGEAPVAAVATNAGREARGAPAETEAPESEAIEARGEVPVFSAADLAGTSQPRAVEKALTELEVDSAVVRDPLSAAPHYPSMLLRKGVEGSAAVLYIVDTLGAVDTMSYRVVAATHAEFAVAVRRALPDMRFRPAIQSGHRVRQLVQQTFRFRITPRDSIRAPQDAAPPA